MKSKIIAAGIAIGGMFVASAENYVWSPQEVSSGVRSTDWGDVNNWYVWSPWKQSTVLPGEGDTIVLGSVTLTYDIKDEVASNIMSKVSRVHLDNPWGSHFVIKTYAATENEERSDTTIAIPLAHPSDDRGYLEIIGGGIVRLTATGTIAYKTKFLNVGEDCEVWLPQTIDGVNNKVSYYYGFVDVAEGAKLYLTKDLHHGKDSHIEFYGLSGSGSVYNTRTSSYTELRLKSTSDKVFSGYISKQVKLFSDGVYTLDGKNDINQTVRAYGGYCNWSTSMGICQFTSLGLTGAQSPVGTIAGVESNVHGGNFRYVGTGETTDKYIWFYACNDGYTTIDGGPNGGLILGKVRSDNDNMDGGFDRSNYTTLMTVIGLNGSNKTECVLKGHLDTYTDRIALTNASPMIIKKGTGTWRFANPDGYWCNSRGFGGTITVEEGTFKYDSSAPRYEICSVGKADMLTEPELKTYANATKADWAFALGGKGADLKTDSEGTLEYTGTEPIMDTDRKIVLKGDGRIRANGPKVVYQMIPSAAKKAVKLTLDGTSTAANEVADVTDTATYPVSVVKEGAGNWTLSGSQSFHGTLTVKGGTLKVVKRPKQYTWYKFTVKDQFASLSNAWKKGAFSLNHLGLYDAEGNNLTIESRRSSVQSIATIEPGQCNFGTKKYFITSHPVECAFTNEVCSYGCYGTLVASGWPHKTDFPSYPQYADPATWASVVVRPPANSAPVVSYDWVYYYGWGQTAAGFQRTPNRWSFEGSVDGIHWEDLNSAGGDWTIEKDDNCKLDYYFVFSHAKANRENKLSKNSILKHSGGCAIASASTTEYEVLNNVSGYAVSNGAKLIAEIDGSKPTIGALTLDKGANTIDGFEFGSTGTLNVTGFDKTDRQSDVTLATTFANASGLDNVANWSVSLDGKSSAMRKIDVVDGKIVIRRPGMVILFK